MHVHIVRTEDTPLVIKLIFISIQGYPGKNLTTSFKILPNLSARSHQFLQDPLRYCHNFLKLDLENSCHQILCQDFTLSCNILQDLSCKISVRLFTRVYKSGFKTYRHLQLKQFNKLNNYCLSSQFTCLSSPGCQSSVRVYFIDTPQIRI